MCDVTPDISGLVDENGAINTQVDVRISITGDFKDSENSVKFTYYQPPEINSIEPRYGPKDGGTKVRVTGENFQKTNLRCSFGSKTVEAKFVNDKVLECEAPRSEVVALGMPLSVSMNDQQFAHSGHRFYYYNWPQIKQITPPLGPESGGTNITLKGSNFQPFHEIEDEIDNSRDVFCGFVQLKYRTPAIVRDATTAYCTTPASYYYHQTEVELTLNGEEYTEDEQIFTYYKPPTMYDLEPREGPVEGNTTILISGANFEKTNFISCQFGDKVVPGVYINSMQIECVSPAQAHTGWYQLRMAVQPDLWSQPVKYMYYGRPLVTKIEPECGPDSGFTQIEVNGKNFLDLGTSKALCVFNNTIFTNATVFSDTLLYCDSPVFQNSQGYSLMGSNGSPQFDFYNFGITIDGGVEVVPSKFTFNFYRQPKLLGVTPFGGPLASKTAITLNVTGLDQPNICNLKIRLGLSEVDAQKVNTNQLTLKVPEVKMPGTVHIQASFNGQQFTDDRIVHLKDPLASFEYYQNPLFTFHWPQSGLATGKTQVRIMGEGFKTFKAQQFADPEHIQAPNLIWLKMVDVSSKQELMKTQIDSSKFSYDYIDFETQPAPKGTKALIQISRNGVDWHDVKSPRHDVNHSFEYFQAPSISEISPAIGPVKPAENSKITITGSDFVCPEPKCSDAKARFTDSEGNQIFESLEVISSTKVIVTLPLFAKPDVLVVELTLNGVDFTNNKKTYGFFDPFLIDVRPKLISNAGTTQISLMGLGFVESSTLSVRFVDEHGYELTCDGAPLVKKGTFVSSKTVKSGTFKQSCIRKSDGSTVNMSKLGVQLAVLKDEYTKNKIFVHSFSEPKYKLLSSAETPSNVPAELLIQTRIDSEQLAIIKRYGQPKCRFSDGSTSMITEGQFVHSEGVDADLQAVQYNSIRCLTPVWTTKTKVVTLDLSVNDYDFSGNIQFQFAPDLILHRVFPMAAPMAKATEVTLIGEGFRPVKAGSYETKWGVLSLAKLDKTKVADYTYYFKNWLQTEKGNCELQSYWYEAGNIEKVDTEMKEAGHYDSWQMHSQLLLKNTKIGNMSYTYAQTGGPFYIEVGRSMSLNSVEILDQQAHRRLQAAPTTTTNTTSTANKTTATNSTASTIADKIVASTTTTPQASTPAKPGRIFYEFHPSAVELYHYPECTVSAIYPKHGLIQGGTSVQVMGYDFLYAPEWGLVPHCRFGSQIVKATFYSNVRLTCESPVGLKSGESVSFEVSLNGHDFTDSGTQFTYYTEPKLQSFSPDWGQSTGGTEIFIYGQDFPNLPGTGIDEINVRFRPIQQPLMEKKVPVQWMNSTTLKVVLPGGWENGDKMNFQITWNGIDYDKKGWMFTTFSVSSIHPRSGPADGSGGDIIIKGSGFRENGQAMCRMNGVVRKATKQSWNELRCPEVPYTRPVASSSTHRLLAAGNQTDPTFFGNVDFSFSLNNGNDWQLVEGGFQYYQQPIVTDISPKNGPAHGIGIINFYGDHFRADYALVDLECKVGNNVGVAVFVNSNQIRCVVEDMDAVPQGQQLPAQVALNGYSWTKTVSNSQGSTFFTPYTVNGIFPNSGRVTGGTEVLVIGSGFVKHPNFAPRCKFGTAKNFKIVAAQIVNYNKMVCVTPSFTNLQKNQALPFDVPFSIALTEDEYEPFTATLHHFRYYNTPLYHSVTLHEVDVGTIKEQYVKLDPAAIKKGKGFFEPYPGQLSKFETGTSNDPQANLAASLLQESTFYCRFGRFGDTPAIYVNETTVKCLTPYILESPADIYREKVTFSLSLNGYDEEITGYEFTFVGTAPWISMSSIIITIFILGLVIFAFIWLVQKWYTLNLGFYEQSNQANVILSDNSIQPHMLRANAGGRSMQSMSRGMSRGQSRGLRPDSVAMNQFNNGANQIIYN